ncbi:MAG: hypothetical protein ACK4IS_03210 [Erythrobacter sp.]
MPRHLRRASAPAAAFAVAGALASAAPANGGLRWRLSANVPVICAIIAVRAPSPQPTSLAVTTTCNAERYRLVLTGAGGATLRAARSSAGHAAITADIVTITSTRPGNAIIILEFAAPIEADRLSVTLQPI